MADVETRGTVDITTTSAAIFGTVWNDGGAPVTERGICYNTTGNSTTQNSKVTAGNGDGFFTSVLTGLTPGQAYYARAYAINSVGTAYGYEIRFTTKTNLATISTTAVSSLTATSAMIGGNISNDGGAAITERGICFSTTTNPTTANIKVVSGSGTGSYTVNMTGLTAETNYYVRAYAISSAGTAYGNEVNFLTPYLTIGTQVWRVKNLDVSTYRNGDPIPKVTDNSVWNSLTTGAWCWYNNDSATYAATYGKLYNWYAVNDSRGLAPTGWHIPSDAEWTTLSTFLGGDVVAGDKLKEAGITHWHNANTGTNSSGFTGLPGGLRAILGTFGGIGGWGHWWSSAEENATFAWVRTLSHNNGSFDLGHTEKYNGLSVRCIKD